jgi:NADPH-dependent curcumin reductase CurA
MSTTSNHFITLRDYVDGRPVTADDFTTITTDIPEAGADSVLVQTLVLSVDPALRGSMSGRGDHYLPMFTPGEPIHSRGVGRVVASRHPDFAAGDLVTARLAWSEHSIARPELRFGAGTALAHARPADVKLSHHLGVLGNTGQTAFFGVLAVARPRPGDSVLVSGAAGGVGSVAGQIARLRGARVIGLAGSDEKCRILRDELNFDDALNYRDHDLAARLDLVLPDGPTIYFDNVGGEISQLVMDRMPERGKVVECGQISTYDDPDGGWKVDIRPIHRRGLRFEGFTRSQFEEFMPAANAQLAHWLRSGAVVALETERHGLLATPEAFLGMLRGENIGKTTVTVGG